MEETAPPAEDLVSKYKRLLSMAKASLETNQKSLADKDAQISQQKLIIERLERERLANPSTNGSRADETSSGGGTGHTPRNILRRVDVNGAIWILVQYDSNVDTWVSLSSEQDLDDFMRRVPGSSLVKPHRCFTPAESQQLEAETKFKIDRVVEEFRRYKVKSEIARKQSSDDTRSRPSSSATHARSDDAETDEESHRYRQENARLQSELGSLESKWKLAYEKVIRENESLRHSGGEAMLAAQWRERFENTSREKMHLLDKLRIYESSGSKAGGTKSIEEAYNELKDEHKVCYLCALLCTSNVLTGITATNECSRQATNERRLRRHFVPSSHEQSRGHEARVLEAHVAAVPDLSRLGGEDAHGDCYGGDIQIQREGAASDRRP